MLAVSSLSLANSNSWIGLSGSIENQFCLMRRYQLHSARPFELSRTLPCSAKHEILGAASFAIDSAISQEAHLGVGIAVCSTHFRQHIPLLSLLMPGDLKVCSCGSSRKAS